MVVRRLVLVVAALGLLAGSAAEQAGLAPGDVIVAVDGDSLEVAEDLLAALREQSPGDRVELTVVRGAEEHSLVAVLTDRPEP